MNIPLTVPKEKQTVYLSNFELITKGSGRLMLFAGDQKTEHLNDDFFGDDIASDDIDPEHLFKIAHLGKVGVFATQLGLISLYGNDYKDVPYMVKINSKTHLVKTAQRDPLSNAWFDIKDIIDFKKQSGLAITSIGYTIFLGSEYESTMLKEAAQLVNDAHKEGLIATLWIYPRGKGVSDEKDPHIIAGAAGVGATLGADFVKVNYPKKEGVSSAELLKEAVLSAGRTKIICAGGPATDPKTFLQTLHDQIHISGTAGNATGRNIHQKPLDEAVRFCNAINAITVHNKTVEEALKIFNNK